MSMHLQPLCRYLVILLMTPTQSHSKPHLAIPFANPWLQNENQCKSLFGRGGMGHGSVCSPTRWCELGPLTSVDTVHQSSEIVPCLLQLSYCSRAASSFLDVACCSALFFAMVLCHAVCLMCLSDCLECIYSTVVIVLAPR